MTRYAATTLIASALVLNGSPAPAEAAESLDACSSALFENCLNGVSTSVTNGAGLRVTGGGSYDQGIGERVEQRARQQAGFRPDRATGLAAGDAMATGLGAWVSVARSSYDSDFAFGGQSLAYQADADNLLAGADFLAGDRLILGVALGYQQVDADTAFNGGSQQTDALTLAPYLAWLVSDTFSVDLSTGYSALDYDQARISPTDGSPTSAAFDADRWFVTTHLNALFFHGDWTLGARLGLLHTEESQDGYVERGSAASATAGTLRSVGERDLDLTQLVVGGDVAYHLGRWEPYLLLLYRNDLSRSDGASAGGLPGSFTQLQPDDDDEFQLGVGVRFFATSGLTGNLEYSVVEGRDAFSDRTLLLTLRGDF